VIVGAAVLSGCAQPGFNAQKLQRQLVQAGATPEQAQCVTSGLQDGHVPLVGFDLNELASHSEPTDQESVSMHALLHLCEVKPSRPASTPSS